ncbi:hypothetical protein Clocl_2368 [Acetivibrio clariflavus DSM 19732]|uniref:Uncharacterized protein n=1 Tax=Acetivibrio clariflavus (strain DSM 19732 / NBRC 101661 / EBR45) TaxID=720554 RepID=G8LZ03_ACECE|nr:hypothetical protein Clocl_2368 [Acetivibrio clariflavus DSM 19732]
MCKYDIIEGSMVKNVKGFLSGKLPIAFGYQMFFHTEKAINILRKGLKG